LTDLYPDEQGYIGDGLVIGYAKAAGSITLHGAVSIPATGVSSYVSVQAATLQTGVGIALRAADTNDYIPVVLYGIVKQTVGSVTFAAGKIVTSGTTAGTVNQMPAVNGTTMLEWNGLGNGGTTALNRLGLALQPGTTAGDLALIAVGKFV
jgi:hypothetical protein